MRTEKQNKWEGREGQADGHLSSSVKLLWGHSRKNNISETGNNLRFLQWCWAFFQWAAPLIFHYFFPSVKLALSAIIHTMLYSFTGPSGLRSVFHTGPFPCTVILLPVWSLSSFRDCICQGCSVARDLLPVPRYPCRSIHEFFINYAESVAQQCWRDPKVIKILCHRFLKLQPTSVVSNWHCWG